LTFNQAELSQPASNRPNPPPPVPVFQQQPPGFQRPNGLQTPTPHVRGVIQRNPGGQQLTVPNSS
ncbi:MAG TPA: hypothetical protein VEI49_04530, partial [Terriglobales bacterium]|nr:hypothetical protein [Terriglobales bacterium]